MNFVDPSGLLPCIPGYSGAECGFGGWGGGFNLNDRVSPTGGSGRQVISDAEYEHDYRYLPENGPFRFRSAFISVSWTGLQDMRKWKEITNCQKFSFEVQRISQANDNSLQFMADLWKYFVTDEAQHPFSSEGFKPEFRDDQPGGSPNQARHYVGGFIAARLGGSYGKAYAAWRERDSTPHSMRADLALHRVSGRHAFSNSFRLFHFKDLYILILRDVCE